MKVDIRKRFREVKWTTEYCLSNAQRKELIQAKIDRAKKEIEARKKASLHDKQC
jgi:hypothetical protein